MDEARELVRWVVRYLTGTDRYQELADRALRMYRFSRQAGKVYRNEAILADAKAGLFTMDIAAKYEISQARVGQILRRYGFRRDDRMRRMGERRYVLRSQDGEDA